jgi:8-oxo-dGTP diphosphatase
LNPGAPENIIARTPRLFLRKLAAGDDRILQPLANDWEVVRQTARLPFPFGAFEARNFVDEALHAARHGKEMVFAVLRQHDQAFTGLIGLVLDTAPVEIGYWLGQKYWGQGYASEAVPAVMRYAQDSLKCRKLDAIVFEDNHVSARVLIKCGFWFLEQWEEDIPERGGLKTLCRYQWRAE